MAESARARELDCCSCEYAAEPFEWISGEEKPRCRDCAKPVQFFVQFSTEESQERASAVANNGEAPAAAASVAEPGSAASASGTIGGSNSGGEQQSEDEQLSSEDE